MRICFTLIFAAVIGAAASPSRADALADLRSMPVLQDGRIKPFDSAARLALYAVSECNSIDGRDASGVLFDWAARPWDWEGRDIIYVGSPQLHDSLHLPVSQARISPGALRDNIQTLNQLTGRDADDLRERLATFELAASGHLFSMVPGETATADWIALPDASVDLSSPWRAALRAWAANDPAATQAALLDLHNRLWTESGIRSGHPAYNPAALDREVFYNRLQPFKVTAWAYGVALLLLGGCFLFRIRTLWIGGMVMLTVAVLINGGGFAQRCLITGWAPVTNFFETVLWVAMVSAAISVALSIRSMRPIRSMRRVAPPPPTAAACGALIGLIAAIVGANLPAEYGSSFRALPLALRTNFWLTLHVLTIVSSYGALAISMVAGNVLLAQAWIGNSRSATIESTAAVVDRSVQIGLALAITGTLLGALWADMAWGRFWGWDPKEVWALIIILAYLALLHLRISRRLDDIEMAAGSTVCFATVLMSWYGVNFVLAAGMHSYGFERGAAAGDAVAGYLIFQLAFASFVLLRHKRQEIADVGRQISVTDNG